MGKPLKRCPNCKSILEKGIFLDNADPDYSDVIFICFECNDFWSQYDSIFDK